MTTSFRNPLHLPGTSPVKSELVLRWALRDHLVPLPTQVGSLKLRGGRLLIQGHGQPGAEPGLESPG